MNEQRRWLQSFGLVLLLCGVGMPVFANSAIMLSPQFLGDPPPEVDRYGDRMFLRDGGLINGQIVDADHYSIQVDPGELIIGSINIQTQSSRPQTHVIPMGGTVTWGDRRTQRWEQVHDIRVGTRNYTLNVNRVAPAEPGTYHIVVAFWGEFTIDQVFSASSWHDSSVTWFDGNDLGFDWDASQFQTARDYGWVINAHLDLGVYRDWVYGANWVEVRVGTPIPEPATLLAGLAGLAGIGRYVHRRK